MKPVFALVFLLFSFFLLSAQADTEKDAFAIRKIYDLALTEGRSYEWLRSLTTVAPARLSGSPQAAAAIEFARQMLDSMGVDRVELQPCMVPHWVRGKKEVVRVAQSAMGSFDLKALALGGSGAGTVAADVIEVKSLDALEKLGRAGVEGKIVFFNRPFNLTQINTFAAYGGAVDQRGIGPAKAAKLGALAVMVRSMTNRLDDIPHTGGARFEEGQKPIPAVAISTNDAERLGTMLQAGKINVYIETSCQILKDKPSFNVIADIRGSEKPNEIIVIGGHLDSWDVAQGAHDDGAGCVQAMDVLYLMKKMGYKPKRTIRCVLFMNEENGLAGGKKYAEVAAANKNERALAALESDSGGFTPRGFRVDAEASVFEKYFKRLAKWSDMLSPYNLELRKGSGGADINPLKPQKTLLIGFEPDSQRYFDYHHTAIDTFDAINKRELELGAAAMTSLVFLLDKYGLE
jgi:carboxypeptidase Q